MTAPIEDLVVKGKKRWVLIQKMFLRNFLYQTIGEKSVKNTFFIQIIAYYSLVLLGPLSMSPAEPVSPALPMLPLMESTSPVGDFGN